jgi:uncharacterized protein
VTEEPRPRRATAVLATEPRREEPPKAPPEETPPKKAERLPYLLDFFPLESAKDTQLSRFYERLREGRMATTRCPRDQEVHWPPRTVCPKCHAGELEWIDLPGTGRIYAFSAVLAGAPLGMEGDVPFAVGLVDVEGTSLRIFGRIEGRAWNELHVGEAVRLEPYELPDGRWFYRFRAGG